MKIIAPESLADVKWILQHWKTTKLRLPDRFEGWHYKPGMTEDEQMALVDLAITHQYPIPADFSCGFSVKPRQDGAHDLGKPPPSGGGGCQRSTRLWR